MSDTTLQGGNQAGQASAGQPQSTEAAAQAQAAAASGQAPGEGLSLASIRSELDAARKEAAKYRTERNAFETDLKKRQEAEMSETERLKARSTELEQQHTTAAQELRQERALRQVERAARKLNIVDEDTAGILIRDRIEFDDKGQPTNIEPLLTQLIKDKPFLVTLAAGGTGGAAAPPAGSAANPTRAMAAGLLTEAEVNAKTPDWIAKNWEIVEKSMAAWKR